ncbi:MAG: arginine--tRNA ligase [Gammaproteobacteria bacterium]|nr:MAG: arginine--tRNA ligase [Gammaproteobacteria bacterium]
MQSQIAKLISAAIANLQSAGSISEDLRTDVHVARSKDKTHGDFACNVALQLAKQAKIPPRKLAEMLLANMPEDPIVAKIEIAGPGFLNFYIQENLHGEVLNIIMQQQDQYGLSKIYADKKVQIEFVSANPTGPLHVGHGRGAAYGATIGNLLAAVGYEVQREYYVNDAGRQIDILTASVWLRYLELCDEKFAFPTNGYQGDYVWDIAATLHREHADKYNHATQEWVSDLPADEPKGGDKEVYIDAIIAKTKTLLGESGYGTFTKCALDTITNDIKDDLELFGVHYDNWFSEKSLVTNNKVHAALATLEENGHSYIKDDAIWFRSTNFGDEKDRVLVRANGSHTYFASDIAYHLDKYQRGFDKLINIWGADHHGYITRIKAAVQALGKDPKCLQIPLVQFANLYRGGEKLAMSTRSGEFVTLRELRKQVGKDAARFFYVMRKHEQHLDFDLDLATSQSKDNPVFYVQYVHARICRIFEQAGIDMNDQTVINADTEKLSNEYEKNILKILSQFTESISSSADKLSPHILVNYLRDVANAFHSFYDKKENKVLVDDVVLRNARLKLIYATKIVIHNGLTLLDVSAPQRM